ncbi:MAG: hypothetical protein PVTTEEND_000337 [Candidatus Fervidibacter sp.]
MGIALGGVAVCRPFHLAHHADADGRRSGLVRLLDAHPHHQLLHARLRARFDRDAQHRGDEHGWLQNQRLGDGCDGASVAGIENRPIGRVESTANLRVDVDFVAYFHLDLPPDLSAHHLHDGGAQDGLVDAKLPAWHGDDDADATGARLADADGLLHPLAGGSVGDDGADLAALAVFVVSVSSPRLRRQQRCLVVRRPLRLQHLFRLAGEGAGDVVWWHPPLALLQTLHAGHGAGQHGCPVRPAPCPLLLSDQRSRRH